MNHLCFIIDNSLPMQQQPYHSFSLLDSVKSSVETALSNLSRLGFPNPNQHIHLFVTSQPLAPLSSFEHDENHLLYQLKSIKAHLETDPATTIQTALNRISHFRILAQAETLLGYREAYIYEPALIIFLTNRMTKNKIQKIVKFINEGKIHMRSQYQFVTYIVSQPSLTQRNVITEEKFKNSVENKPEVVTLIEAFRKINGETKVALHPENLNNFVWLRIENYKPFLFFNFQLKEMKQKMSQFAPSERGSLYFRSWQHLPSIPFQLSPFKICKIPFPFQTKCVQENGQLKLDKLGQLHFYIDLTKNYMESVTLIMPENRYKILPNPFFSLLQNEKIEQRYPIFFQYKQTEHLIGLLQVTPKGTQAAFYFSDFPKLNTILKNYETHKVSQKSTQSSLYPYLIPLPSYYLKFVKIFLDKLQLQINYKAFDYQNNTQNHQLQARMQNTRSMDKKNVAKLYQVNLQAHKNSKSQCCLIYSPHYNHYSPNMRTYSQPEKYFNDLLQQLFEMKAKIGIEDYISSTQISSTPMTRELQKYDAIKRMGQDQFNENISFGNPYKKKRKTISSNSQSESNSQSNSGVMNPTKTVNKADQQQINKNNKAQAEAKIMPQTMTKQSKPVVGRQQTISRDSIMTDEREATSATTKPGKVDPRRQKYKQKQTNPSEKQSIPKSKPVESTTIAYIPCETVKRINSMPRSKDIEVAFNLDNINTQAMLKNESIIKKLMTHFKKK